MSFEELKGVSSLVEYDANDVDLWISTGLHPLDFIINTHEGCGGIPAGRITQIYGPEACGKSTLLAHIFNSAHEQNISTLLVDAENRFDQFFASRVVKEPARIGMILDKENLPIRSMESFFERFHEVVTAFYESNSHDTPLVVALDSIDALKPVDTMQMLKSGKYKPAKRQVADVARAWGPWYSQDLVPALKKYKKLTFIALNQERDNIRTNPFSSEPATVTPGGRAVKFYSSLDIRLDRTKKLVNPDENYTVYALVIRATVTKSSVGTPFRKCSLYNGLEEGFVNSFSTMWALCDWGVFKKQAGKTQSYGCDLFTVDGKVAGKKLKKKKLELGAGAGLLKKYGWNELIAPVRKELHK